MGLFCCRCLSLNVHLLCSLAGAKLAVGELCSFLLLSLSFLLLLELALVETFLNSCANHIENTLNALCRIELRNQSG